MLSKLKRRFQIELNHFLALPKQARLVLTSYFIYQLASSLIYLFVNVYLWRNSANNITFVLLYNASSFVTLPLGFYFNGLLIKRGIHSKTLYWLGALIQGFAAIFVVYLPTNLIGTIANGLIGGLGSGLFWANKNYLSLTTTKNANRTYYNNIEYISSIFAGLIMPLVAGWFIYLTHKLSLLSLSTSYKIIMLVGFSLFLVSGFLLRQLDLPNPKLSRILLHKSSYYWQLNRFMHFFLNVLAGINFFLPSILIMYQVANEGVLGTLQSVSALLSAFTLYLIGRKTSLKHSLWITTISLIAFIFISLQLGLVFNFTSVVIYLTLGAIIGPLRFIPPYTLSMDLMDKETRKQQLDSTYPLIVDNEIIFNLGRLVSLFIFWLIFKELSQTMALKFTPLIVSFVALLALYPMKLLLKYVQ